LERRRLPRYQVDWLVKLTGRNNEGVRYFGDGVLENISARGAYLYTERSLQLGEKLDISIQLPLKKENWLVYSAEVVRVDCASDKTGLALMFDSSKPAFTDK
jgi:hypothetical protein